MDVFISHIASDKGIHCFPFNTAGFAVWMFFALSAYVLVRAWDGRFVAFLVRRFVRLWPLYALCISIGYFLTGTAPEMHQYFFLPVSRIVPRADPPAWSLTIEAAAMLFMPLFVWISRGSTARALISLLACLMAMQFFDSRFSFGIFFIMGGWAARFNFQAVWLEKPVVQWLGKICYPLYLSHCFPLLYLPGPIIFRAIAAFGIAELLTITVERWSINASRAAGRKIPF